MANSSLRPFSPQRGHHMQMRLREITSQCGQACPWVGFSALPRATTEQSGITWHCSKPSCRRVHWGRGSLRHLEFHSWIAPLWECLLSPVLRLHCSNNGDGGGPTESVGLFRTPEPPPQILVQREEKNYRTCRVRRTVGVFENPTGDLGCAPLKRQTSTHL
jgi:hypothetical protein